MSADDAGGGGDDDDGPGRREVAHRVFAAEYDDATLSYKEGDEERAPTYVVTPSGAKANRLFLVGVLTEVEQVNDDMLRARIVDPTGAFVVYAGQYQPEARATIDRTSPPAFLAVAGKARTFQPEDGDRVFSSVRPESVNVVDAGTRDRWAVETARATLRRVGEAAETVRLGEAGDPTDGVALALEHYGTTPGYLAALRDLATDAAEVVAGDREEVRELDLAPDEDRPGVDLDALVALLDVEAVGGERSAADPDTATRQGETAATATGDAAVTTAGDTATDPDTAADDELTEIDAGGEVTAFEDDPAEAGDDLGDGFDDVGEFETGGDAGGFDDGADDDVGEFETGGDVGTDDGTDGTGGDDGIGDFEPGDGLDAGDDAREEEVGDFEPGGVGGESEADAAPDPAGDVDQAADEPAAAAGDGELYEMDDDERERIESEFGTEFATGTEVDDPGEADIDTPDPDALAEEGETAESTGTDAETEETDELAAAADADGGDTAIEDTGAEAEPAESDTDAETGADDVEETDETDAEETNETDADESDGTDAGEAETGADDAEPEADESDDTDAEEADESDTDAETDDTDAEEAETESVSVEDVLLDRMAALDDGDGADRAELVATVAEETGADADAVEEAIQDALMSGQCYEPDDDRLKPI